MKRKKGLGLLVGCIAGMLALSSCSTKDSFAAGDFSCEKIDETSIAIGTVNANYSSNIVFVPTEIDGYTVTKLGYESGLWFPGNGTLIPYRSATETTPGYRLERFYCPNTITDINHGYMQHGNGLKVFYCGATLNLGVLAGSRIEFYVPNEEYNGFYNVIYEDDREYLYRANVAYLLNYETENPYYYVDNYEYGTEIEFIPPNPKREGYTFVGWYKEAEGLTEWQFTQDALLLLEGEEEYRETKLYAKWQKQ